jgi:hypothetical protein
MKSNDPLGESLNESAFSRFTEALNRRIQHELDRITPYLIPRWTAILVLLFIFMYNVVRFQGFYIIAYVLGIFLLNQFILFLTPSVLNDDFDDDSPGLPTHRSDTDEFRPFMRRLPEFKFWYTTFKACLISIICTYFEIFDIPVFWPILVMYFIILFFVTMKRQILHMIKHKYVPFSYGKMRYQNKSDTGSKAKSSKN